METIMETVLNKIFSSCDPCNTGTTNVSKIMECISPFMQSNLADLRELRRLLNTNDSGDEIVTKNNFEQAMKSWVAMYQDPKESCVEIANTSLFNDFDDKLTFTKRSKIGDKLMEGYAGTLELSKFGDVYRDKTFFEDRIKELEHINRKMADELMQHKIQEQVCEETIENLKMAVANINQKLANSKHTVDVLEKDLVEFEELREKNLKFVQKIAKLEKRNSTIDNEIQNLKQKNENLKDEKKSLINNGNLKDKKEIDLEISLNYLQDQLLEKSDLVDLLNSDNEILKMNNCEQRKYVVELQNIIDTMKCSRFQDTFTNPTNAHHELLKDKNIRRDYSAADQDELLTGILSPILNLQAELDECDCSFDKTILQDQLDAIEHRCCKESKKRLANQVDLLNLKLEEQRDCTKLYMDQIKDYEQIIKDYSLKEFNLNDLIKDLKVNMKKQEKLTVEKDYEINKLNIDIVELDSYASKVKAEFENNFLNIKDLESNLKDTQIANANALEHNKKLQYDLDLINISKLDLEKEMNNLKMSESECDIIKEEFDNLEKNRNDLDSKLTNIQEDNRRLENISKELNQTVQSLEKRNNEIIDSNKILLKDSEELNKKLDLKIKEMQVNNERKLDELSTALDMKKLDFDRVSHELNLSQRNFSTAKEEKKQFMLQINLLEVRINEVNKWNQTLKLEKEQLTDELTVFSKKLKNRDEQHANLKIKFNELTRQKGDCSKSIDDSERKIRSLENEIRKLQCVNEDNCLKILGFEEKLALSSEKEIELSEIKTGLSSRLNQTNFNLGKLESTLKDLLQNEEFLQSNCDHLKLQNHNLEARNSKLQNEISKLTAISTTFCENCNKLQGKLNEYLKLNKSHTLNTCQPTDLTLARKDSYGKLSLRLEKVQNKLELKETELNQSQIMVLDLKEKLSHVDPNFSTANSISSNDDLEFLIRQLTVDRLILQSALNAFVTKWRTALKKIPKAQEIIHFIDNEDQSANKSFPNNFKELHMLTKYISFIALVLTIINDLKPNPLNNLNTKSEFVLKPAALKVDFLKSEEGKSDTLGGGSKFEAGEDLFYNSSEISPTLTDAVLESLQLSGDSSGNISEQSGGGGDNSRLEYRICQLMVSFRLDGESIAGRYAAQAQVRDHLDSRLLGTMRCMMRMIDELMAHVAGGGGEADSVIEEAEVLQVMQNKLQQINVLCCRIVQSAEQLGALHHEHKLHRALHLISNYVSKLEKIIFDQKLNPRTKDISIIKTRKSLTNTGHPKFTILRSFESSTQTNEKQKDNIYYFLIVTVCIIFGIICSLKSSISQNVIPWNQLTWDEIFNQIFDVKYLSGRPM